MKKLAFVILNYLTAEETEKCIESIMNKGNTFKKFEMV